MPVYQNYITKDRITDFEFVLPLIRADINEEQANEIRLFLETTSVDWQFVLSLVQKQRVLPVFYANMKKLALIEFCPKLVQKQLASVYLEIIANNLRLSRKLARLLVLFETHGVPAVPFKGPILAYELYCDGALRYYQDLDILTPEKCVGHARNVLERSGFFSREKDLTSNHFNQLLKYGRECDFTDRSGNVKIDLHWQLGGPFRRSYDYEFCEHRLRKIKLNNRTANCLSHEDTLLHLCVNGAHDIWNHLEKILCVADYMHRHPDLDWKMTQKLAGTLHCRRMLFLGLFLANDIFDAAMPVEIAGQIEKDEKIKKIAGNIYAQLFCGIPQKSHIEKRAAQIPYYLMVREHFMDKLLYILRRIFIPTQKDRKNRCLDSRMSRLYFLLRPIDLMVEFLKTLRH